MRISRLMMAGAATAIAGIALLGLSFHTQGALAGGALPCGTPTQQPAGQIQAAAQVAPTCAPSATKTTVRIKTHTTTATATSEPVTATPVPPTNTAVPPTKPSGGNEGVAVKPPDTGSGASGGNSAGPMAVLLGVVMLAIGGGALVVGARQRN